MGIKWEYRVDKISAKTGTIQDDLGLALNRRGLEGWELISCASSGGSIYVELYTAVFKRPIDG